MVVRFIQDRSSLPIGPAGRSAGSCLPERVKQCKSAEAEQGQDSDPDGYQGKPPPEDDDDGQDHNEGED
jgi:hypothetical protein